MYHLHKSFRVADEMRVLKRVVKLYQTCYMIKTEPIGERTGTRL